MHMQYMSVMKRVTNPKTRMTMPIFHTTGGSVSCRTMMKPMQMRMRDRLVSTIKQHTPLVLGQKGLGADIVSTASPAFMVFLDLTVLIPLALVRAVPLLFALLPLIMNIVDYDHPGDVGYLRAVLGLYPTPTVEPGLAGV